MTPQTQKQKLLTRLAALGFPLMAAEAQAGTDANASLAQVVKMKDPRLWEAFPLLLANAGRKGLFSHQAVVNQLSTAAEKKTLRQLVLVSLALYRSCALSFAWADGLQEEAGLSRDEVGALALNFKRKKDVSLLKLSLERVQDTFRNYYRQQQEDVNDVVSLREEFSLEQALSQVFSPKQKELFFKKLNGEKLTKTEKEYFSRVVKKKAQALANEQLLRLARQVLG